LCWGWISELRRQNRLTNIGDLVWEFQNFHQTAPV
jgi:hypothetical protein